MANKLVSFLEETKTELKKVTWPTRNDVAGSTVVVLGTTLALSLFIGFFDYLFTITMRLLIK